MPRYFEQFPNDGFGREYDEYLARLERQQAEQRVRELRGVCAEILGQDTALQMVPEDRSYTLSRLLTIADANGKVAFPFLYRRVSKEVAGWRRKLDRLTISCPGAEPQAPYLIEPFGCKWGSEYLVLESTQVGSIMQTFVPPQASPHIVVPNRPIERFVRQATKYDLQEYQEFIKIVRENR